MHSVKLGVNIDHIATLRQARGGEVPDPVLAASVCEAAGADSIVIHLREDRRHIQEKDLYLLRQTVKTRLNLEMSAADEIVSIACKAKPDQATLVPEKRKELTTEGGLDVIANFRKIKEAVRRLSQAGIEVSLFIDPDKKQISKTKASGAKIIELHTGRYAEAQNPKEQNKYFKELESAARYAQSKNLRVNAGHGLNYSNVAKIAKISGIEELNIGYAIIARAVFAGLDEAVREMKELIQ